jgi:hypothetical protein
MRELPVDGVMLAGVVHEEHADHGEAAKCVEGCPPFPGDRVSHA